MSSTANKIKKNMSKRKNIKKYEMYGSLAGSAIVTIGKLAQKTEEELIKEFDILKDDENFALCKNVVELCTYLAKYFVVEPQYLKNLILVYDEENFYTPCVTLIVDDNILPLDRSGTAMGILANLDKDSVYYEYIYEDDDDGENEIES